MQMSRIAHAAVVFGALILTPSLRSQSAEDVITETFGREGDDGSFRAQFHRLGGGLAALQTLDHFRDIESKLRAPHESGDYMLLVWNGPRDHALRLAGGGGRFPQDLLLAPWQYTKLPDGAVEFAIESGDGLRLVKTLRYEPKERGFDLEIRLENTGAAGGGELPLELLGAALTNPTQTSLVGNSSFGIGVPVEGTEVHATPKLGESNRLAVDTHQLKFAGTTSRFFGAFLYPRDEAASASLQAITVDAVPPVADAVGTPAGGSTRMRYGLSLPIPAKDGATTVHYGLYFGPKSYRVFASLSQPDRFAKVLDVDLTSVCCVTIPFGKEIAKGELMLLGWFHDFVHNWGFAIMMLTVLVRGLLAPLNFHMQKSMRAYGAKMAKLKPKMDALKKQYEDDPKAYQQAMIALQREHKLMPPLGGCLPMFLSMPVYYGLFTMLRVAYDLRQQPFVAWIHDLSVPDGLAQLPFWPHVFNLLPLCWIGLFVFMTLRQPLPTDPQQRSMQRMMRIMPIAFGVMLYGYASALMVYMVTSMLWSLVESAIVKKILGPVDPNVASMAPTPM